MTLPELPEPAHKDIEVSSKDGKWVNQVKATWYTPEQMLAFQRETVEACAKAVEAMVHGNVHTCAATIRRMK